MYVSPHQFNFMFLGSANCIFGDFQKKTHKHETTMHAQIRSIAVLISVLTVAVQVSGMKNKQIKEHMHPSLHHSHICPRLGVLYVWAQS